MVSACLLGQSVRYDGRHSLSPELAADLAGKPFLALCPEIIGGLGLPRAPAHFEGAREGLEGPDLLAGRAKLVDSQGRDVSRAFAKGAEQVLDLALSAGVTECYLKDRSPSCGYDPRGENPRGGPGLGVLAALLLDAGVKITEVRAKAGGIPAESAAEAAPK